MPSELRRAGAAELPWSRTAPKLSANDWPDQPVQGLGFRVQGSGF